jgi:hypothetical protein
LGDTKESPVDELLARHLWLTWKEGQAGPRRRPQPFSRVLTAKKVRGLWWEPRKCRLVNGQTRLRRELTAECS